MMTREKVYTAIDTERDYQDLQESKHDNHVSSTFNYGDALTAIRYNLRKSEEVWYNTIQNYEEPNEYLRKIAAICVKMGENFGMKSRK